MQFFRLTAALVLSAFLFTAPAFASHIHRAPTSGHVRKTHHRARRSHRLHGQQAIDSARVTQIQQALIKAHYMSGEPNGDWDSTTLAAMRKFQADQGWQTKLMPDSRALKKLGLGADYSNAINAKDAHFTPPPPITTIPSDQSEGFMAASGVSE